MSEAAPESGRPRWALLVIDVQLDFCAGGALAVPDGDRVVEPLNRYIEEAVAGHAPVYASRDWHPAVTSHFAQYGGTWPVHCVQATPGAGFHPRLRLPDDAVVVTKGDDPSLPGYSAFDGRVPGGASLAADLRTRGVTELYVGGLATDYCVKHTVLDGLAAGFQVAVLEDAVAGVNVQPGDSSTALAEMTSGGARLAGGRVGPH
jgi:nicotinamidase/pyrazinamidase